ncbi:MAG: hypothetical protein N2486_02230 [Caloramator sp.]|nr:hypothetical protein [Caloramator sp.]
MKKILTAFLVVVISLLMLVTIKLKESNFKGTNDKYLLDSVIEIEKSIYELNNLKIPYSEFMKKTKKYLSDYFQSFYKEGIVVYANDDLVYSVTNKHFSEVDWIELNPKEFEKIAKIIYESSKINTIGYNPIFIKVSKIYDDAPVSNQNTQFKHVFVKRVQKSDGKDVEIFYKYNFIKDNDKYILFSIEPLILNSNESLKFNNTKVEFIKTLTFDDTK